MNKLEIKNLTVKIDSKEILKNINLDIQESEIVVIMGPNGAGKSSIGKTIMGHPKYEVVSGNINLNNLPITNMKTEERAKNGLFMSFQDPISIDGITMASFLRTTYNQIKQTNVNTLNFFKILEEKMNYLDFEKRFRSRSLNYGFSGGEKKKSEILQLMLYEPKFAILDEIDSGLDVDALKIVGNAISKIHKENKTGFLIITHHNKILEYITPDKVIILKNGTIEKVGDLNLAKSIELNGFN